MCPADGGKRLDILNPHSICFETSLRISEIIIRLAKAMRPCHKAPNGFIHDGAAGRDMARAEAAAAANNEADLASGEAGSRWTRRASNG